MQCLGVLFLCGVGVEIYQMDNWKPLIPTSLKMVSSLGYLGPDPVYERTPSSLGEKLVDLALNPLTIWWG